MLLRPDVLRRIGFPVTPYVHHHATVAWQTITESIAGEFLINERNEHGELTLLKRVSYRRNPHNLHGLDQRTRND